MLGETVSHYLIAEQLGAGGMGVVYKARDLRLERDVAIKVIRPEFVTPALQAAFLREARLASALNHPGIVTIHDILTHDGRECIVMEYIAGAPLQQAIPSGGMDLTRALHLALQIGEAVAAAHAAGIVHRDLKPANVLLRGPDGTARGEQAKILDFGLAKLASGINRDDAPTHAAASIFGDKLIGTLAYMAPEAARGEAVDQRADIFSFGVILYQMFTGRLAFPVDSPAALVHAVQTLDPAPLRQLQPAAPAALEALLQRALAKPVAQRYQSMAELVADLRGLAQGAPTLAAPPPSVPTPAAAAPPRPDTAKTSIAVLPFRSLSLDPEDVYLASGLAAEILGALTGVPGLRIAPQQAAFRLSEQHTDPMDAAAALAARYVVAGTLRRAGDRIRVSAELADSQARRVAWSHNYDRRMTDIFAVQEDISRAIVAALGGELIRATTDHAHHTPAANLDAWGLARKAYHVWNYEFSLEGVAQALGLLRRALELDPGYAQAHALLGFYLITTVINRISTDLDADRAAAVAAAELACRLAPEDPEVLESAALVWQHTSQYEKAVTCLKRAVRLAPFDLVAWGYLGFAHACAGGPAQLEEARQILARLIADAPDHPSRAFWHQFSAIAALRQSAWQEAADHGRLAVEMQPGFVFNQVFYAEALCRLGRPEEARAVLATIRAYNPHFTLAVFEDVALRACRSLPAVEQLCGQIRARNLFPPPA